MSEGLKITLIVILSLVLIIFGALSFMTRNIALDIVRHPMEERPEMKESPENYGLAFEKVMITTEDGLALFGWFIPGDNGGTVMIQHGSPGGRQDGLYEAAFLNKAGLSVLLGSFRAHDECEGNLISFGYYEQKDLKAWHQYLLGRDDVDPGRIGLFGESMGGGTSILYAAGDPGVQAVATGSAFSLTQEVVEKFIEFETDLPPALIPMLAKFIVFWVEQEAGFKAAALDTESVIADISPVPVMIIHGGADDIIGPQVGLQLFEAAAEPKELIWIEEAGHVNFEDFEPEVYQEAMVDFFNQYLLGD
ncbi:MAG: alpha/beta hydrolase [Anaerolineales bacterium]|nr:MAG: alpha/beta hydrolase [Anaerolineales bacterium]